MPCYTYTIGETKTVFRASGRGLPKPCVYCGAISGFLCDYPIGRTPSGKRKDCDRALCSACTQKGVSENVDFCREHYPLALAAYQRRQCEKG